MFTAVETIDGGIYIYIEYKCTTFLIYKNIFTQFIYVNQINFNEIGHFPTQK